ncbi:MAG: pantetheine-phosphate adenylyltransferase [Clostridia bacterium]|nr:pantetheine-phosphate adenylyltransferase [Clostridia bacterium]
MSIAIVPGSFDPITEGHLNIVKRALTLYDEVVVAVMNNAAKTYMFDMDARAEMARRAVAGLNGVRVVADSGMLVDLFDRIGAEAIVKGVRNGEDLIYEQEMADYNLAHNPRAKTVLLEADASLDSLSSTRVREHILQGKIPAGLPDGVLAYLSEKGVL